MIRTYIRIMAKSDIFKDKDILIDFLQRQTSLGAGVMLVVPAIKEEKKIVQVNIIKNISKEFDSVYLEYLMKSIFDFDDLEINYVDITDFEKLFKDQT